MVVSDKYYEVKLKQKNNSIIFVSIGYNKPGFAKKEVVYAKIYL